jgi:Asp-tRNA(Asn)/Glu-tRNA(Gln) amidotransferase C subunit
MSHMPSNAEVTEIAALARLQLDRQQKVEQLEQELKDWQASLRQVQEVDLPNAMQQAGVSEIKLPTGEKITIKDDVYASIPKDERYDQAMGWLRDHGFGDVIKNEVKVAFGKGEEDQAVALMKELNINGWKNYTNAVTVHSSTLKALIREQLAKGSDFPLELFGAMPVSKAVIK